MNTEYKEPLEKEKRRQKKRSRNTRVAVFLLLFASISVLGILCSIYYASQYYTLKRQTQEAWNQVQASPEGLESVPEGEYTKEQVDKLILQAQEEENEKFLSKLKRLMTNGDGTTAALRNFYPNEVVIADSNKYYFFPILDTLQKNTYLDENFKLNEKNELEYFEGENRISQKGIDVSKYQGKIDWKKVKEDGVSYAFIRVGIRGYGTGKIVLDEMFVENTEGALAAGVKVGAYFVTQAITEEEAIEEAEFVLENIKPYQDKITYPIVLDVEQVLDKKARTVDLTQEERTKICIAFLEKIREANYQPMIYGNLKSFMLMLDMTQLEPYPKWFANYNQPVYFPYKFDIWQYTDKGTVAGIKEKVDLNVGF